MTEAACSYDETFRRVDLTYVSESESSFLIMRQVIDDTQVWDLAHVHAAALQAAAERGGGSDLAAPRKTLSATISYGAKFRRAVGVAQGRCWSLEIMDVSGKEDGVSRPMGGKSYVQIAGWNLAPTALALELEYDMQSVLHSRYPPVAVTPSPRVSSPLSLFQLAGMVGECVDRFDLPYGFRYVYDNIFWQPTTHPQDWMNAATSLAAVGKIDGAEALDQLARITYQISSIAQLEAFSTAALLDCAVSCSIHAAASQPRLDRPPIPIHEGQLSWQVDRYVATTLNNVRGNMFLPMSRQDRVASLTDVINMQTKMQHCLLEAWEEWAKLVSEPR